MTREEIEQLNGFEPYCIETDREQSWYEFGLVQGLETADANPKSPWISVKDDLPCNHEELLRNDILTKQVLVVSKDKEDNSIRVCTNYMLKVGIFSQPTNEYRWSGKFYNEVTHWMPLPEPPKE